MAQAVAWGFEMIVLLAAGIGVCIMGLLAVGFGIPISDTSFGNALLIAGVVVLCTGMILLGMWFVARELAGQIRLALTQGVQPARSTVPQRSESPLPPPLAAQPDEAAAPGSPPPWADEAAARARPQAATPELRSLEPELPSQASAAPDRPARRNLLFASKRRDKEEQQQNAAFDEPRGTFESAWPSPARPNGATEHAEPPAAPAGGPVRQDLPPGVTVMKSGVVDGMSYTLYSDGSIEAQFAGESPIRFPSFEALRVHVEQQRQ